MKNTRKSKKLDFGNFGDMWPPGIHFQLLARSKILASGFRFRASVKVAWPATVHEGHDDVCFLDNLWDVFININTKNIGIF